MTNFKQAQTNGKRGANIKDGSRGRQPVQPQGFWGVENFRPTRRAGQWIYTWQGIKCPFFIVTEMGSEIRAVLEGGEIEITFTDTSHVDIKNFLDDKIDEIMGLQADVADPLRAADPIPFLGEPYRPAIIEGEEIGPEIPF